MSNMVVQTNVLALNSHRYMKQVGNAQSKSSARLSSGYKINSAADDAAGLAISEKMRAQIRGLDQASKNAQDGISLIQTAEGGMQEIDNMLQRIRELVVSVSNDTNENNEVGTGDRQKMQDEIDQLVAEIDSMSERVEFNKKKVINGSYADTALQLRNAKAEYDRSSLAKVETNAKLSAYKDALGVSDDTSNATGTTAYSRLNAAQDAVDAGVAPYTAALKAFTAAEVTYTEAQKAYNTTRQTMDDQLSKVNLEAADITNAMLDKTDTTYLGDEFARAFTAYQEASNTWGIEELGFVTKSTGTGAGTGAGGFTSSITIANALTKAAFTGATSADDVDLTAVRTAQSDYAEALAAAEADPLVEAYLKLDPGAAKLTAYEKAKNALENDTTFSTLTQGSITASDITGNSDLLAKLEAYVKAADDYGVDELNLAAEPYATQQVKLDASVIPTVTAATNAAAAAGTAAKIFDGLQATTNTDAGKAAELAKIEAFITANGDVATAGLKKTYDDAKSALAGAVVVLTSANLATLMTGDATAASNTLAGLVNDYINAANDYGVNELGTGTIPTSDATSTLSALISGLGAMGSGGGVTPTAIANPTDFSTLATAYSGATATSAAGLYNDIATLTADAIASGVSTKANTDIAAVAGFAPVTTGDTISGLYQAYADATTAYTLNLTTATNEEINASQAAKDYAAAADAWGADAKGFSTVRAATLNDDGLSTADKAKYVPTVTDDTADNPTMAAAAYAVLSTDQQDLVDDVVTTKAIYDAFGEYGKYQIEDEKFKAAEATYNDLVAKRDAAQKTVNTLTSNVESTEKEKTRTDMLYNVANAKLDTAKIAVAADDSQALYFQVGANAMQGLEMSIGSVKSDVLGIGDGKGVTNIDVVKDTGLDTTALLDVLDTALSYVTTERSRLGAAQNRLEYTIKSLDISSENLSAAESRIRDTDMAKEMMELTKANTLQQASISMLAQANQAPQSVLQLLG